MSRTFLTFRLFCQKLSSMPDFFTASLPWGEGRPISHPFSSGKGQKTEVGPLCPARDVGHARAPQESGSGHWNGNTKHRAAVGFACEIDESVVELKDSESHGESNSAAAGLRGVEERKDFLA